jgi:hypothetical protein
MLSLLMVTSAGREAHMRSTNTSASSEMTPAFDELGTFVVSTTGWVVVGDFASSWGRDCVSLMPSPSCVCGRGSSLWANEGGLASF